MKNIITLKKIHRLFVVLLCACFLGLPACGTGDEPQQQTKQVQYRPKKKKKVQKVKEPEKKAVVEEYSYDASGKADPFQPLFAETASKQQSVVPRKKIRRSLTPLQKFDISDLKLVAVITSDVKSSALLQDPSGFGYIVKEGMLVGLNDGMLKKILPNGIIIEEQLYNASGELETKTSTLTIQHNR